MKNRSLDGPDIRIERVKIAASAAGRTEGAEWTVSVNGREVKRFPSSRLAEQFVVEKLRSDAF
jgi:hypothetical protein